MTLTPPLSEVARDPRHLDMSTLQPEKLRAWHRERLAVVYVRQSTAQQVLAHQESTRLQYGLVARAEALGWPTERVLVIDDDLGKSGTSAAGRAGFQRLVSEVGLGHVGLILGVEMSRLARSNADWHRLLEVCALFGTLIADLDGLYDPTQYNDRLLLGLKGTMSEAELHLLKQRLYQGCLSKARALGGVQGITGIPRTSTTGTRIGGLPLSWSKPGCNVPSGGRDRRRSDEPTVGAGTARRGQD